MMARRILGRTLLLTLLISASSLRAEVYQWTDSRGVIHFTDDIYSVPESIRGSPQLTIRRDLDREEKTTAMSKNSERVVSEALPEPSSDQESQPSTPISESSPSVTFESPQPINIIIVNIHRFHPRKKPCLPPHGCAGVFKPNFNDRRFIHPSVFDGGSTQFIQPRLFSRPRTRK